MKCQLIVILLVKFQLGNSVGGAGVTLLCYDAMFRFRFAPAPPSEPPSRDDTVQYTLKIFTLEYLVCYCDFNVYLHLLSNTLVPAYHRIRLLFPANAYHCSFGQFPKTPLVGSKNFSSIFRTARPVAWQCGSWDNPN